MANLIMKVDAQDLQKAFESYGRENQFSRQGIIALHEYLENLAEDCGTDIELDVIALCCEYNEYGVDEIISNYDLTIEDGLDDGEIITSVIDQLSYETSVVGYYDNDQGETVIMFQAF